MLTGGPLLFPKLLLGKYYKPGFIGFILYEHFVLKPLLFTEFSFTCI